MSLSDIEVGHAMSSSDTEVGHATPSSDTELSHVMAQLSLDQSTTPKQPTTFFGLPFEVRTRIYALAMRADCGLERRGVRCNKEHQHPQDFTNAISLMYTCKQVYVETFEIVRRHEIEFTLEGRGPTALRDPREFGKPGYFEHHPSEYRGESDKNVPLLFEPLQVASLRKVHLKIVLPLQEPGLAVEEGGYNVYSSNVDYHIYEFAEALGKSWTIQQVRLTLIGRLNLMSSDDEDTASEETIAWLQPMLGPSHRCCS